MTGIDTRTALLTGHATETGQAVAGRLAVDGLHVVRCGGADADHALDPAKADSWRAAAAAIQAGCGPLSVLVMLAEPPRANDVEEAFLATMRDGLSELFLGMRAVAPVMRANGGGAIVIVGYPVDATRQIGVAALATFNAALVGLVRAAAVELGDHGIRVNLVRRGAANTASGLFPLHRGGRDDRRGLEPRDVAGAVAFLVSDDAAYVSGTETVVDGGLSQSRNSVSGRAYDARQ